MLHRFSRVLLALALVAPLAALPAQAQHVDRPAPVYMSAMPVNEVLIQTGRQCGTPHPSPADQARVDEYVRRYAPRTFEKMATVTIPVAFHVVTRTNGTGDVPNSQLEAQIDVLNDAFAPLGFQFTLASIDRTANDAWYNHISGTNTETQMKEALAISPETTLNFYTGKPRARQLFFTVEILGYATFPSFYPEDDPLHGVVVDYQSLPGGALAAFNEGDTGTHEVGHWVGLFHTFQGGCSGQGDSVADTPAEAEPFYGNQCNSNRDTCPGGGPDPITNFMDYSDDICLSEFTSGQAARAQDQMATYRPTIFNASGGGPVNQDPTASFTVDCTNLTCDFTDTSSDPDGTIVSQSWDFGDGNGSSQADPIHIYADAGTYTVSLTVTDDDGATDTANRSVTVTTGGGGGPDTVAPNLSGAIQGSKYEGTASDSDSGLSTIILREDTNLDLDVDAFSAGAASVDFTVTLQNRRNQGKGFAVATDVAGNESELWICSDGCAPPSTGGGDTTAPTLTGRVKASNRYRGKALDDESGISTVTLASDAVNLRISTRPYTVGDPEARYTVQLVDGSQPGSGTVVAADVAGNEGTRFVEIDADAARALTASSRLEPGTYALGDSYPNPFASQTRIDFALADDRVVTLTVMDLTGREVARLVDGYRVAGTHSVTWDALDAQGRSVAAGVYVYRIQAGDYTESKRLVVLN
ncbi:MAG: PKD domain-containing protein [Bacteroidota bacterium]